MLAPLSATTAGDASEDRATLELLRTLIRMQTVNPPGDTREVAEYLEGLFRPYGVKTEVLVAPNGKAAHFIARLEGDGSRGGPLLLAAHSDVVPVERQRWSVEPFAAIEKDGYLYGRGALDNKAAVAAFARAVLRLIEARVPLGRDIIFLSEADEEQGQYNTTWLARHHWEKIACELSLNEGGYTLMNPDGTVQQLNVTYGDKLTVNFRLSARGPSGHSSRPRPAGETANGQLITALAKLNSYETDIQLSAEVIRYLQRLAELNGGPISAAVAQLLEAGGQEAQRAAAAKLIAAEGPTAGRGVEGLLRNTVVITMIQSGIKPNVIPGEAYAVMNARLLPGETVEAFMAELEAVIGDSDLTLEIDNWRPPAERVAYYRERSKVGASSLDTELFTAIEAAAAEVYPDAVVLPSLLVATTDATPWRARGIPVYGLGPLPIGAGDLARVHGDDERLPTAGIGRGTEFVYRILLKAAARP